MNLINKILKDSLLESKNVGLLYHYTSFKSLKSIIINNKLQPTDYNQRILKNQSKTIYTVSTTRNKNWDPSFLPKTKKGTPKISKEIKLILDGNKISQNYRIIPYNDFYEKNFKEYNVARSKFSESEETIITNSNGLINLRERYLIKIELSATTLSLTMMSDFRNLVELIKSNNIKYQIILDKQFKNTEHYRHNYETNEGDFNGQLFTDEEFQGILKNGYY